MDSSVAPGFYTFTVVKTDDETGEVVDECNETLQVEAATSTVTGLTEAEVKACIAEALEAWEGNPGTSGVSPLNCDSQALRETHCGKEYILADWNGDRFIEADRSPVAVPYDGIAPNAADAVCEPGFDADGRPDGIVPSAKYAYGADGCITHVSICDVWYGLASSKDVETEPGFDYFCIPGDMTFPMLIDSSTSSITIGGIEYPFDLTCPPKSIQECPSSLTNYAWGNTTGTPLPDVTAATVLSDNALTNSCEAIWQGGWGSNPPVPNIAMEFGFPQWSPNGGPCLTQTTDCVYLGFDLNTRVSDIGVGLKVDNSFVWADNLVIVSAPAGAVAGTHYTIHGGGSHLRIQNPANPLLAAPHRWELKFFPQSITPSNGAFNAMFWAMTGPTPGARDEIARIRMRVEGTPTEPCYQLNNPQELAALINTVDPNTGVTWVVQNGQVCAYAPEELGPDYSPPQTSLNI